MKAFILAAGYGTRLEPLTIAVPKPMVPIANLPTMQHNLELLQRHGFTEISANIHYHPEQIENYFGDGYNFGVNLNYSYEEKLLGTAGGVRKMALEGGGVDETFLVLSSDALTDINLTRLVEQHKKNGALATVALAKVSDVTEFGVVVQDEAGKITGFQEKPAKDEALSDLVNAGVYVFEPEIISMLPEGFYDFGKQLFPELVKKGAQIFGYQMVEYWSDVGCLDKYIAASFDAMKGAVQIRVPGKKVGSSVWIGERERLAPSARFEGAVIIGDRCVIGKDAYIKDAVIGDKCVIGAGAAVSGSVIWSDTTIADGAVVDGALIGGWCHIGRGSRVSAGAVLANRSVVRPGAQVPLGARVQPNTMV